MATYAGISEEACAFRLLIKFGHREAIRHFTNMAELKTWPDESVMMCMQVLLSHGALLVEDPTDPDQTLDWATKRLAACKQAGQDTLGNQKLLELIQAHSTNTDPSSQPSPSSSSTTAKSHWGKSPASDVRALMQHVLRYGRDQQRRVFSYHPHCATAALAAACGMGPQMRDVVHWMLAIAAHVDGIDIRQLRRKRLRRRVVPTPVDPPSASNNTTGALDGIQSAFQGAGEAGWPTNPLSSEIHAHSTPDGDHTTTCNTTADSHSTCNGHTRDWSSRGAAGEDQPGSPKHKEHHQPQLNNSNHTGSHPHHRHHTFTIGNDEELKAAVVDHASAPLLHTNSPPALASSQDVHTNGVHLVKSTADVLPHQMDVAVVAPYCNRLGTHPHVNGGVLDSNTDMSAYLERVDGGGDHHGVDCESNGGQWCGDNLVSSNGNGGENGCVCNGGRMDTREEGENGVCGAMEAPKGCAGQQPQEQQGDAAVDGDVCTTENGVHASNGNGLHLATAEENAAHGQESDADDMSVFSNPFTAMQQHFMQQHMRLGQVVLAGEHVYVDPLTSPQTRGHDGVVDGAPQGDGHEQGMVGGGDEECIDGDEEHSWLDFLTEVPGGVQDIEEDGWEVAQPEEDVGEGEGGEEESDVEKWVLSPLAEAAAAGDRYVVELLLEVHGATPDAHGGLAERVGRVNGNAQIAKIIYEKTLSLAVARGGPMVNRSDSPAGSNDAVDGDVDGSSFQYVTLSDWLGSMMPRWDSIWGGGKGRDAPVVYRSRSGGRYKQPLRYFRLGLALAGTATVGYLAYSCLKGLALPQEGSGGEGGTGKGGEGAGRQEVGEGVSGGSTAGGQSVVA